MKSRPIREISKPRIRAAGAGAETVRVFIAERIPDARMVAEDEQADYVILRPDDFEELIEDRLAEAAYERSRSQEQVPAVIVDRLLGGENPVRVWREHRGLTLDALAQAAGTAKGYLSQIETGKRKGTIAVLRKLATVLAVDLDDLAPP